MREEEDDLSFADFAGPIAEGAVMKDGSGRLYLAPASEEVGEAVPNYAESMVRREGFEPPTLRFEA
jgi:hypothetical protein